MDIGSVASLILIISGSLTVLGLLIRGTTIIRRTLKRLNLFFEDFFGEPARPGVPERPGMVWRMTQTEKAVQQNTLLAHQNTTRLDKLQLDVTEIWYQINHNHGTSMRDDITAIKKAVNPNDTAETVNPERA